MEQLTEQIRQMCQELSKKYPKYFKNSTSGKRQGGFCRFVEGVHRQQKGMRNGKQHNKKQNQSLFKSL